MQFGTSIDGARVAPINPWRGINYLDTGRNSVGVLTNDGVQVSREEAVRLYAGQQQTNARVSYRR
jgi:predicted amidohydrolase YtcJ